MLLDRPSHCTKVLCSLALIPNNPVWSVDNNTVLPPLFWVPSRTPNLRARGRTWVGSQKYKYNTTRLHQKSLLSVSTIFDKLWNRMLAHTGIPRNTRTIRSPQYMLTYADICSRTQVYRYFADRHKILDYLPFLSVSFSIYCDILSTWVWRSLNWWTNSLSIACVLTSPHSGR
jgi:hypothetical protein